MYKVYFKEGISKYILSYFEVIMKIYLKIVEYGLKIK